MTTIDPTERLHVYVQGFRTKTEAAKALSISPPYLHDMLNGARPVSDAVLQQIGLERVVTVRKARAS